MQNFLDFLPKLLKKGWDGGDLGTCSNSLPVALTYIQSTMKTFESLIAISTNHNHCIHSYKTEAVCSAWADFVWAAAGIKHLTQWKQATLKHKWWSIKEEELDLF